MSASVKQHTTSNAAVRELWRIAEAGEVDELGRVCSRGAHVNARNKHGMTALMRAARNGHALMVRALLERGADPNMVRNDKFTALALAAFFGHTETVKILVEHGANSNVVTRCGASAHTWATARTFEEAARYLDSHVAAPAPARAPAPAPARVLTAVPKRAPAPAPTVTQTLKDPPEIWDLVHEVPQGFDARSAFVSRLTSLKTSFALRIAAAVVVSAGCVVGVLVLRGSQARSLSVEPPANQSAAATEVSAPVNVENKTSETPVDPSPPAVNEFSHHSESSSVNDKPSRKGVLTRQTRSRTTPEEVPVQTVQSREVPAAAPVIATPQIEPRKSPTTKSNTSLSPQLITPAQSDKPKAKVIQWP